jgi:universal stress protein E
MRLRRIMVALPAWGAISPTEEGKIAALASALESQVELFHCAHEGSPVHGRLVTQAREDILQSVAGCRQRLEMLAERLRARGLRVRTSVRWDYPPYAGIVRQVLRHEPSLLIAHPTRRGPTARRLLGRTDFRLLESCPCPVLFIKTRRPYVDSVVVVVAAVDSRRSHHKLAALDAQILGWGSRLRDALGAKLLLFHAHPSLREAMSTDSQLREAPEPVRADVAAAWRNGMEAAALALAQEYAVPPRYVRMAEGPPAEELAHLAAQVMADIVIVGVAARSRFGSLMIGHTAEKVFDSLASDLLVVKPAGFRSSVSPQSTHHLRRGVARAART